MAETDFSDVLKELEGLDAELDAMRVVIDEGEEMFDTAPTARQSGLRHLGAAMRHTVNAARALIDEADWEEPEDGLDALEILVEEDVLPGRVGQSLVSLAEYAAEHGEDVGWDADADSAFEQITEAVEVLAEFQEYLSHFLREWSD